MNTAILLSAFFFLVSSTPITQHKRQILENIMKDLNFSLPENLRNKLVPDVLKKECHNEDFCKAEQVLLKIEHNLKNWTLIRSLSHYSQTTNCTIVKTGNELQLRHLLDHLRRCAQKFYANLSKTV
ncbi:interleukin-4/13b1 precursor [Arapaima gigas]